MSTIEIVLLIVNLIMLGIIVYAIFGRKKSSDSKKMLDDYQDKLNLMKDTLLMSISQYKESVNENLMNISKMNKDNIKDLIADQDKHINSNTEQLEKATQVLKDGLEKMQKDNTLQLDKMRNTVEEKIDVSLRSQLNQNFQMITKQLNDAYKVFGEMKSLETGVGDLKKVLTNVKTRGSWGEVQLGSLLKQMFAPNQYESQYHLKKNKEAVDFVLKIPSSDDSITLLPIDSKFPMEDYQRLIDASDKGDNNEIAIQTKNIEKRIKEEGKTIKDKYIVPPITTDFAIMYLPTEGLLAEVLRNASLVEYLHRNYNIIVCGPTTIAALLNSLQLVFKTITIQKRSTEVWNLLGSFRNEFEKFVMLLEKTQKKLLEASDTIDTATRRSRKIEKKLKNVSTDTIKSDVVMQIDDCKNENFNSDEENAN